MTSRINKSCNVLLLITLVGVGMGDARGRESETDATPKPRNAWQPPKQDRSAFRDIVDYNIFRSDRGTLAAKVDQEHNPPTPRDPVPVVDKPPPNPDSFWRLSGITHAPDGAIAFIEHTESGELSRLTGPTEFSKGEVTAIGYDAVMYVIDGEQRVIHIGETLMGERVIPPGGASRTSSGSSSSKSNLSAAERLRLLKEQRAREQGTAPPAETPESSDVPATPDKNATPDADKTTEPEPGSDPNLLNDTDPSTDARANDVDNNS